MKRVFGLEILFFHSISLWFLYTSSSLMISLLISLCFYEFINIQHHMREAKVLWLSGWGFHGVNLPFSSTPMFIKPQTDRHIIKILLWRIVMTSFTASYTTVLGSTAVSQPLNAALHYMTPGVLWSLRIFPFSHVFDQWGWGEWCWWLWLVLDWRRVWWGSLDELHQQVGLIREIFMTREKFTRRSEE